MHSLLGCVLLEIRGHRIPRVLLGTSPFIAAGQFGVRSFEYELRFVDNPKAVERVVRKSLEIGVRGIHVLPYPWVYEGVKSALESFEEKITIVGTLLPDDIEFSIRALLDLSATITLVHGVISDMRSESELKFHLEACREVSPITGVVVHEPMKTLTWLKKMDFEIDIVMAPINRLGKFLDTTLESVIEIYRELGIPIIGKKVLAAGMLKPKTALEFIRELPFINSVALGVASSEEAEETFKIAFEFLGKP
ncbi:MAG: hypothetical protein DRJ49_05450 [Thermoprotei archaeon]|nr:MAG: hypothetical protein DRJ49_05450 [Thermoprotei archaeon]